MIVPEVGYLVVLLPLALLTYIVGELIPGHRASLR
jgi:hypothetical protein